MNCHEFDRWLNEGSPAARRSEALAHARSCARCAAALRAVETLEALLVAAVEAAPAGFSGRVMARVAMTPQVRVRVPLVEMLPLHQTFPWWVRIALEPASVLAMLLAAILSWRGDVLYALTASGAARLAVWLAAPPSAATAAWLEPGVLTCVTLAAAPLFVLTSWLLYRWSAGLVGPRHLRAAAR